jgi:hypothetical protein
MTGWFCWFSWITGLNGLPGRTGEVLQRISCNKGMNILKSSDHRIFPGLCRFFMQCPANIGIFVPS